MTTRRGMLGWLVGGCPLLLGGCGLLGGNNYRFRMTVDVETPQGMKSGTSVYEVMAANTPHLLPEEGVRVIEVRGQALVVDLPLGPIFVLMKPESGRLSGLAEMSMASLDSQFRSMADSVESADRIAGSWSTLHGEVPRSHWPMMVRFRDIRDPKSAERVDPETIGVKRITVETTNDRVTTGLKGRLPWLTDGGLTLDPAAGPTFTPTFPQTIYQRVFTTEIRR